VSITFCTGTHNRQNFFRYQCLLFQRFDIKNIIWKLFLWHWNRRERTECSSQNGLVKSWINFVSTEARHFLRLLMLYFPVRVLKTRRCVAPTTVTICGLLCDCVSSAGIYTELDFWPFDHKSLSLFCETISHPPSLKFVHLPGIRRNNLVTLWPSSLCHLYQAADIHEEKRRKGRRQTHISTRSTLTPHGSVASSRLACRHSKVRYHTI